MPTNLPPDYFEVEKRYRAAKDNREKITLLEELISTVPRHKGTEKLLGDLRRRLSKLKSSSQSQKKVSRQESAYNIEREGAGQVVVVGAANVGKSSLVTALTNANPEVSASPYSTWTPSPGMMLVGKVQIQLIDTPPLDRDYIQPQLIDLIRRADLILVIIDIQANPIHQLEDSLSILAEYRIFPDQLQDQEGEDRRIVYLPMMVLVNKTDDGVWDEDFQVLCELVSSPCPFLPISVLMDRNLDFLRHKVFERLDLIRIYAKPPGEEPDLTTPFVMKRGSTVAEFAGKVHQDFYHNLKSARIWGTGVFDGQMVGRDHELHDEDIVELRL